MSATSDYGSGTYALIRCDSLYIVVPHREVRTLEAIESIDFASPPLNAVGAIQFAGLACPVYCFSEHLKLLAATPASRKVCVVLRGQDALYGLLCSEASLLKIDASQVHEVPQAMCMTGGAIQALVLHNDLVICVSSAELLLAQAKGHEGYQ